MEKIAIVDENDAVIEVVESDKFDKSTGRIYRVSALFLCDSDENLLIHRRAGHKTYGGMWSIACVVGGVRADEDYEKAIFREAIEEIGLDISNNQLIPLSKKLVEGRGGHRRFIQSFISKVDFLTDDLLIDEGEILEVKVLPKTELIDFVRNNYNHIIDVETGLFDCCFEQLRDILGI